MTKTTILSFAFSLLFTMNGAAETPEESEAINPALEITVVNLSDSEGPVRIAIDTEETWFVKDAEPIRNYTVFRDGDQATLRIDDLEPGVYAVRLYHDEDNDGELNTNFLGIPKEPYGFSGKKTNRMRPRSFDYAQFTLDEPMELTITLR